MHDYAFNTDFSKNIYDTKKIYLYRLKKIVKMRQKSQKNLVLNILKKIYIE